MARENGSATEQVATPQELTKQQRKQIKKEEKKRLQAESDALAVSKERQAEVGTHIFWKLEYTS